MPFFSILIPSYNRPYYLKQSIESVLGSHFQDFELIVSDDCSPLEQEISKIFIEYENDKRIKCIKQSKNIGEAKNRDFLLNHAQGKYLLILGDDDILHSDSLNLLKENISKKPSFDIYLLGYSIIDENNFTVETRRALSEKEIALDYSSTMIDFFCFDFHPFWMYHPATFCQRNNNKSKIQSNHTIGMGDDAMFLFDNILSNKRMLILPDVFFSYRKFYDSSYHQSNVSWQSKANSSTRIMIYMNLVARDNLPGEINRLFHSDMFKQRFLFNPILLDKEFKNNDLKEFGIKRRSNQ